MLEYFDGWDVSSAVWYKIISTRDAAGRTVETNQALNGGVSMRVYKWVDRAVQTNENDKFAGSEIGRIALPYQTLWYDTTVGETTTRTAVPFGVSVHALIDGKKYYVEGVDNVGSLNEVLILTYRREK
jgi:hypothetical protein